MTPEDQAQLQQCVDTMANILYRNTSAEQLQTLEGTEQAIRSHAQQSVLPQLGVFLLQQRLAQLTGTANAQKYLGRLKRDERTSSTIGRDRR